MSGPVIVDAVLYGADAAIAEWVRARIPGARGFGPCAALGIVRDGAMVGGVVFSNWHPERKDVSVSGAVEPGFRIGPAGVKRLLRYAFHDLGCVRITLETGRKNRAARAFASRLGFRLEGVRRRAHDGRQDLIMYGLLREDCRLIGDH